MESATESVCLLQWNRRVAAHYDVVLFVAAEEVQQKEAQEEKVQEENNNNNVCSLVSAAFGSDRVFDDLRF